MKLVFTSTSVGLIYSLDFLSQSFSSYCDSIFELNTEMPCWGQGKKADLENKSCQEMMWEQLCVTGTGKTVWEHLQKPWYCWRWWWWWWPSSRPKGSQEITKRLLKQCRSTSKINIKDIVRYTLWERKKKSNSKEILPPQTLLIRLAFSEKS